MRNSHGGCAYPITCLRSPGDCRAIVHLLIARLIPVHAPFHRRIWCFSTIRCGILVGILAMDLGTAFTANLNLKLVR